MVLPLYRLILLLLLSVLGQGDVLQASTPESYTDQPYVEDTSALTVSPTTVGATNAATVTIPFESSTPPPTTTSRPDSDSSETTEVPATQQPSTTTEAATEETNPTTVPSTTTSLELADTTTPAPTSATTVLPNSASTPTPTSVTTVLPTSASSPAPTSPTTVLPNSTSSPAPTSTTVLPTSASSPAPTSATTVLPTSASSPALTSTTVPPTSASSPAPTNATTVLPTSASSPEPTRATTASTINAPTSVHTVTTASTPAPTTLPPQPNPTVGNYTLNPEPNASFCLMAKMGLQFSFKDGSTFQTVNLDPNDTKPTGTCGSNVSSSVLLLTSDKITVQFVFTNQQNKFHLSTLDLNINTEIGKPFHVHSTNLSLWEASLGSSYMCQKEQSYNITEDLLLSTFALQVQPFNVIDNKFSTAHECSMDDINLLIPIIVGAALAGLIIVVLIAYVIGRRKTYVGYQTL